MKNLFKICLAAFSFVTISSCDDDYNPSLNVTQEAMLLGPDLVVFGLTANNELASFNAKSPTTFTSKKPVSGLGSGEKILSIDFRPATGELYAVTSASKFYVINTTTAAARSVGSAFTPAISGAIASIDFNPTVDRIRWVTKTGQKLRLNPENGAIAAVYGIIATT